MKNIHEVLMSLSPEFRTTINCGYTLPLFIEDGFVQAEAFPDLKYFVADVKIEPRPCTVIEGNVYRIILPHGVKGYAIVSWRQNNDE